MLLLFLLLLLLLSAGSCTGFTVLRVLRRSGRGLLVVQAPCQADQLLYQLQMSADEVAGWQQLRQLLNHQQ
jgi:hypothetical protein